MPLQAELEEEPSVAFLQPEKFLRQVDAAACQVGIVARCVEALLAETAKLLGW